VRCLACTRIHLVSRKTGRLIAVASYGEYRAPLAVGGIIDAWLDSANTPIG